MKSAQQAFRTGLGSLVVLLSLSPAGAAWNEVGHITIAQMAFLELRPQTRQQVVELLGHHPARKSWAPPAGLSPAAEELFLIGKAAGWPDAIRAKDNPLHDESKPEAHFIDLPYAPDPLFHLSEEKTPQALAKGTNIVSQLERSEEMLRSSQAKVEDRARALSWLLHLVGDIHQPLHCASFYSDQFPLGDRGGNDLVVAIQTVTLRTDEWPADARLPNLHALWDDLVGDDSSPEGLSRALERSARLGRDGFSALLSRGSFSDWARESHELAIEEAYRHGTIAFIRLKDAQADLRSRKPVVVPAVPAGYVEAARKTAQRQVALAAFRLADRLEALLGK